MKLALIWNVLGLLSLTNVVIRAVLTAPGPFNLIHAEVPNLMIGTFLMNTGCILLVLSRLQKLRF